MKRLFSFLMLGFLAMAVAAWADSPSEMERGLSGRPSPAMLERIRDLPQTPMRPLPAAARATLNQDADTTVIADAFDAASLNTTLWRSYNNQMSVVQSGGKLGMSGVVGVNSSGYAEVELRKPLRGNSTDVSVEVEFSDFITSGTGSCYLMLNQSGGGNCYVGMETYNNQSNLLFYYYCEEGYAYRAVKRSATAGRLRMVYHAATGVIEGLADLGDGWRSIGNSGGFSIDTTLNFQCVLYASTYSSSGTPSKVSVKWDNFRAQGGLYVPPALGQTGTYELLTYMSGTTQREYRLVVPKNYDARRPIGILFGFHGGGSRPANDDPYVTYLAGAGFESRAGRGYWLAVSLSMRRGAAWDSNDGPTNYDAVAVKDLIALLKQYYAIDENRLFTTGFSSGGRMSTQIPRCLANTFAVMAPECGVHALSPKNGAPTLCIGTGGLQATTWGSTANSIRQVNTWCRTNNVDSDIFVCDMDHDTPPNDTTVWPARAWADYVTDYFLLHPRDYQTRLYPPPAWAQPFTDEFDGNQSALAAARWHVERFDQYGVLYGALNASGAPSPNVWGQKFIQAGGTLHNEPIRATDPQGGYCLTGFLPTPSVWRTSFTPTAVTQTFTIIPAVLRDMNGKVLQLELTPQKWQWRAARGSLASRARIDTSLQTLQEGPLALTKGRRYDLTVALKGETLVWRLSSNNFYETSGTLMLLNKGGPNTNVLTGPASFGLGVYGIGGGVSFDSASMTQAIGVQVAPDTDPGKRRLRWTADPQLTGSAVHFELWSDHQKVADLGTGWNPACTGEDVVALPTLSAGRIYEIRVISDWDPSYWGASEGFALAVQSAAQAGLWGQYR